MGTWVLDFGWVHLGCIICRVLVLLGIGIVGCHMHILVSSLDCWLLCIQTFISV